MGDSLSRKQNKFLKVECNAPISLCCGAGITLCELYMREREIQLAERERALLELREGGEGENSGHKQVRAAWLISKLHSLT